MYKQIIDYYTIEDIQNLYDSLEIMKRSLYLNYEIWNEIIDELIEKRRKEIERELSKYEKVSVQAAISEMEQWKSML